MDKTNKTPLEELLDKEKIAKIANGFYTFHSGSVYHERLCEALRELATEAYLSGQSSIKQEQKPSDEEIKSMVPNRIEDIGEDGDSPEHVYNDGWIDGMKHYRDTFTTTSNEKIDKAISEFENLKSKAKNLKDVIYLDGVLAVLDGIKKSDTTFASPSKEIDWLKIENEFDKEFGADRIDPGQLDCHYEMLEWLKQRPEFSQRPK